MIDYVGIRAQVNDLHVKKVIDALEKNRMEAVYVPDRAAALEQVKKYLKPGDTVSVGGSVSLMECGVLDYLKSGAFNYLDRYEVGLSTEQVHEVFHKALSADVYLASTNAVTMDGELYNIDGNGNRLAAFIYGPKSVVLVVGINKIVKDIQEAQNRIERYACPENAKKNGAGTPCGQLGYCTNCRHEERMCCSYVTLRWQREVGRIKVILVGEPLGF